MHNDIHTNACEQLLQLTNAVLFVLYGYSFGVLRIFVCFEFLSVACNSAVEWLKNIHEMTLTLRQGFMSHSTQKRTFRRRSFQPISRLVLKKFKMTCDHANLTEIVVVVVVIVIILLM